MGTERSEGPLRDNERDLAFGVQISAGTTYRGLLVRRILASMFGRSSYEPVVEALFGLCPLYFDNLRTRVPAIPCRNPRGNIQDVRRHLDVRRGRLRRPRLGGTF